MHSKVKSIIDAWHIFKSSYDETSIFFIVSLYELLNICQASVVDETWCAKIILKILGENDENIKLRKIWGVVLVRSSNVLPDRLEKAKRSLMNDSSIVLALCAFDFP